MKRAIKIIAIVIVIAVIGIQFIRPNFTNPPIVETDTIEGSMQVPEQVDAILNRSCSDCHTNKTVYPWYAKVSPVSWWLGNHISDGRRHLNLSTWNTYDAKRKAGKLKEICEQVDSGEMPLPSYLLVHRDAVLKEGESKILCDWANSESARVSAAPPAAN